MKEKSKTALFGAVAGFCNGVFGSGGGMIVVPFLERCGLDSVRAHATAISVILPLTVVSIFRYATFSSVDVQKLTLICIGGVLGGVLGAKLLKRFSNKWLDYTFGVLIIISAIRMVIS